MTPTETDAQRESFEHELRELILSLIEAGPEAAIIQAGHPVLRTPAADYTGQLSDTELRDFLFLMREVMHAAPGVGLAAPQLGVPLRIAVLEDMFEVDPATAQTRQREPLDFLAIINPSYQVLGEETSSFYEGCLSVAGLQAVVPRATRVQLDYLSPEGLGLSREFAGWQARIVQHETDHLDGTLYVDKAIMRSLSFNAEYGRYWASPGIELAQAGLGFE